MKKYSFLEHTADIRLKLEASTLPELFQAALEGMGDLMDRSADASVAMADRQDDRASQIKETISLSAPDLTALLVDFLSEVLTASHINKAVFTEVTFEKLTEQELEGTITGVSVNAFEEDIKAVTYHEADVKKNENGIFEGMIIFDI